MKNIKKLIATVVMIAVFGGMTVNAMAFSPSDTVVEQTESVKGELGSNMGIAPMSVYGYAAEYTNHGAGTFNVNAPGTAASSGGATIKTSDFPYNSVDITVKIYRPDGSLAKVVSLKGNQEKAVTFPNSQPGNYRISYSIIGDVKGYIHAWIY